MARELLRDKARRLIATANSLLALARELEATSELGMDLGTDDQAPFNFAVKGDNPELGAKARQIYANRRRRGIIFGDASIFGEPVWDIMLDLFVAAKGQKRVAVTSACIGAAVPATTALRWISVLEEKGLILRENDPDDNRRVFVRLTAAGYSRMVNYLAEA